MQLSTSLMPKFPVDAPKARVMAALGMLGFEAVREGNYLHAAAESRRRLGLPDHPDDQGIYFAHRSHPGRNLSGRVSERLRASLIEWPPLPQE